MILRCGFLGALAVTVHSRPRGLRLGRCRELDFGFAVPLSFRLVLEDEWRWQSLRDDLPLAEALDFCLDLDCRMCDGIGTGAVCLDFVLFLDLSTNRGIGTGAVH